MTLIGSIHALAQRAAVTYAAQLTVKDAAHEREILTDQTSGREKAFLQFSLHFVAF
jgi:hypothetical protein